MLVVFLAHLSTKSSWWAFVIAQCPSCVVHNFFKHLLLLNHLANLDETWQGCSFGEALPKLSYLRDWIPIITLVTMATKRKKKKQNLRKSSSLKPEGIELCILYVVSPSGPLPRLFIWCSWGQNWPRPGVGVGEITSSKHRNKERKL